MSPASPARNEPDPVRPHRERSDGTCIANFLANPDAILARGETLCPVLMRMSGELNRRIAIVDGSNVAHSSEGGQAHLSNISLVCERLRQEGFQPIVVADAALRHQIDEPAEYEKMVEGGEIRQAPAGTDADYFILSFARELDASVVSNDRFRDRQAAFPEALERLIRYMIVEGQVVFERRGRRRPG